MILAAVAAAVVGCGPATSPSTAGSSNNSSSSGQVAPSRQAPYGERGLQISCTVSGGTVRMVVRNVTSSSVLLNQVDFVVMQNGTPNEFITGTGPGQRLPASVPPHGTKQLTLTGHAIGMSLGAGASCTARRWE